MFTVPLNCFNYMQMLKAGYLIRDVMILILVKLFRLFISSERVNFGLHTQIVTLIFFSHQKTWRMLNTHVFPGMLHRFWKGANLSKKILASKFANHENPNPWRKGVVDITCNIPITWISLLISRFSLRFFRSPQKVGDQLQNNSIFYT